MKARHLNSLYFVALSLVVAVCWFGQVCFEAMAGGK